MVKTVKCSYGTTENTQKANVKIDTREVDCDVAGRIRYPGYDAVATTILSEETRFGLAKYQV
jgi:hypothetical protein